VRGCPSRRGRRLRPTRSQRARSPLDHPAQSSAYLPREPQGEHRTAPRWHDRVTPPAERLHTSARDGRAAGPWPNSRRWGDRGVNNHPVSPNAPSAAPLDVPPTPDNGRDTDMPNCSHSAGSAAGVLWLRSVRQ
jgi:hypothetical protein